GLRGLGLELALDDFGTAASCVGLLLTCPMTGLKLDRSFVDRLGMDSRPTAVATAVSQIARALNLGTVAEGVESPEQAQMLRDLGYRRAQGFHYSPPLRPDAFAETWRATTAPLLTASSSHVRRGSASPRATSATGRRSAGRPDGRRRRTARSTGCGRDRRRPRRSAPPTRTSRRR